jgi:hypothetical protein
MSRDPSMSPRNFNGWRCDDCGALNESCDATCECDREAERREAIRRAAIARMESLSPAERRARLA